MAWWFAIRSRVVVEHKYANGSAHVDDSSGRSRLCCGLKAHKSGKQAVVRKAACAESYKRSPSHNLKIDEAVTCADDAKGYKSLAGYCDS